MGSLFSKKKNLLDFELSMTHSQVDRDNNTTEHWKIACWKLELKLIDKVVKDPIATKTREDNETQIFAIFSSQETRMILNNPEVFQGLTSSLHRQ